MLERSFARSDRRRLAFVESMRKPVKVTETFLFRITSYNLLQKRILTLKQVHQKTKQLEDQNKQLEDDRLGKDGEMKKYKIELK